MRPSFVVRTLVNAAALWVATRIVPGVEYVGGWLPLLGVAIVFGVVNAFVAPVAKILTLPLIVVSVVSGVLGMLALDRPRRTATWDA